MKILNIDAITPSVTRTIKMKGVDHPVLELSVESFIDATNEADRLEREEANVAEQVAATAAAIMRSVPTLDRGTLYAMTLKQLGVIYRFISGEDEFSDMPDAVTEQGDGGKGEKK